MSSELSEFVRSIQYVMIAYSDAPLNTPTYLSLRKIAREMRIEVHLLLFDNKAKRDGFLARDEYFELDYRAEPGNPGVSWCYNRAAEVAMEAGRKWLLLLDQDAELPADLLIHYHRAHLRNPQQQLACPVLLSRGDKIVSPFGWRAHRGVRLRSVSPGVHATRKRCVHNNGLLVRVAAFQAAGGYNPEALLDYSDVSFFQRYARLTETFVVTETVLRHNLASITEESKTSALHRFAYYCSSAKAYGREFHCTRLMLGYTFLRAVKLTMSWRDPQFLGVFWVSSFRELGRKQ